MQTMSKVQKEGENKVKGTTTRGWKKHGQVQEKEIKIKNIENDPVKTRSGS
jgi:hypothetical protein